MFNLVTIVKQFRKGIRWCVFIIVLSLSFTPTSAQTEVIVQQPVQGLFVRNRDIGQPATQLGVVNMVDATWTPLPVPYSRRARPLWSPDGESIAYSMIGAHSAVLEVDPGTTMFTTETVTGALTPFDLNYVRGWSNDSDSLIITYGQIMSAFASNIVLYDVNITNNVATEIRQWQTDEIVTDMPLPLDATSVQLNGGYRIERNSVFDDWLVMQFDSKGYYSTFDIGEPVNAPINVLWNFRTNEYISLDALVPDLWISYSLGDWSHDGTRLLLYAVSQDLLNVYILTFRFTPEQGVTLMERAIVENRTAQHWLDAGDLFFSLIQDYQNGAAYVLGEIVNGEYRETPFFTLNGDPFRFESAGDWFMAADEAERHRLSCLFEWSLPTRLNIGDIVQVIADAGVGLSLHATPDVFSEQIGLLEESIVLSVMGGPACSGGYR